VFGPPVDVTQPSTCPWVDRRVSGLYPATKRAVNTRFRYGSPNRLTLLQNISRWPIIQKVRSHRTKSGFHCLYVCGFRFYFTPLTGVLFAFPSRYWFTIGQLVVFSLGGWSPHIQTKFHVLRPTRFHSKVAFVYGTITLYRCTFQYIPLAPNKLKGWFAFARRY
jgi:hypothetical protein